MSTIISTFYKESSDGARADVVQNDGVYGIEYYNGSDVRPFKVETFPNNSLFYVESAAENWVMGIKVLNGQEGSKILDKHDLQILNKLSAEHIINDIASEIDRGVPYIDAVLDYAERNGLEVEIVGEIIRRSPVLKAKIYREAEELNMVERLVRLPI